MSRYIFCCLQSVIYRNWLLSLFSSSCVAFLLWLNILQSITSFKINFKSFQDKFITLVFCHFCHFCRLFIFFFLVSLYKRSVSQSACKSVSMQVSQHTNLSVCMQVWHYATCKFFIMQVFIMQVLPHSSSSLCKFFIIQVLHHASSSLSKFFVMHVRYCTSSSLC